MSKLIKAYAITPEKPSYALLKEFNVSDAVGRLFGGKKKEDQPQAAAKPAPEDTPDQGQGYASELEEIATRVTQPPAQTTAYSITLLRSRVKDIFLKTDGGKNLVDAIIQAPEDRKKFIPHQGEYLKMASLTASGEGDSILLIFVPNVLSKKFQTLTDQTVLEEIKKVLSEMMLHRYYVCTFYKTGLQKIQKAVDESAHDAHALLAAFDPSSIYHYRFPADLTRARTEWNSEHSTQAKTDKETAKIKKQGDTASARRKAEKDIIGDTGDLENSFLQIINQSSDATSAANSLGGKINDSLPREQVLTILSKINNSLKSSKITEIIKLISNTPDSSAKEKPKTPEEEDHDRLTRGQAQETYKILGQIIKG